MPNIGDIKSVITENNTALINSIKANLPTLAQIQNAINGNNTTLTNLIKNAVKTGGFIKNIQTIPVSRATNRETIYTLSTFDINKAFLFCPPFYSEDFYYWIKSNNSVVITSVESSYYPATPIVFSLIEFN